MPPPREKTKGELFREKISNIIPFVVLICGIIAFIVLSIYHLKNYFINHDAVSGYYVWWGIFPIIICTVIPSIIIIRHIFKN